MLPAPEITTHELGDEDEFIIIASDGLWDKLSNEEAVALVHDTVKEPGMASKRLATEALTRGSKDNITVIVCFFKDVSTLESVYKDGKTKYQPVNFTHIPLKMVQHPTVARDEMTDGY